MELINRMKKRLIETQETQNILIRSINKPKSRILKNIESFSDIHFPEIKITKSLEELSSKLELIISQSEIKTIKSENVNIEEVFKSFFNEKPPFSSNEKKKYEFPDAFIIHSVNSWCIAKKIKMIFLTKDNDFNGFKSNHLIFRNDLSELLESITVYYDNLASTNIIPNINASLERNKTSLLNIIHERLSQEILFETDYEKVRFNEGTGFAS